MVDKQRVGLFLRALLGTLTVAWVVVAVVAPPDPFTFFLWLVPAWLVATAAAAGLALASGYRLLRDSPLYAPGVRASTAAGAFVVMALVLKVALTFAADLLLGAAAVGYAEGVAAGVLALLLAYAVVYLAGAVSWIRPASGD